MGSGRLALFLSPQEVEALLCLLGCRVGVERPGEVVSDVHTKTLGAPDALRRGATGGWWRGSAGEVNNHLFSCIYIERSVVVLAAYRSLH